MRPVVADAETIYAFSARRLDGTPLSLADFRGKVLLLVNTASQCGFTPQYAGLQRLHEAYAERGFSVIGFPCNQFGAQEPGDAEAIDAFCTQNFGVSFPLSEKIEVKGPHAHPLYCFLTAARPGVLGTEAIKWNFTKFLVDRSGKVVARFAPLTKPEALRRRIEAVL